MMRAAPYRVHWFAYMCMYRHAGRATSVRDAESRLELRPATMIREPQTASATDQEGRRPKLRYPAVIGTRRRTEAPCGRVAW